MMREVWGGVGAGLKGAEAGSAKSLRGRRIQVLMSKS